jgi:hypothetical protein
MGSIGGMMKDRPVIVFPTGKTEGGGEVIVSADLERAELGIGIVVDPDLVVEQLLDEQGGIGRVGRWMRSLWRSTCRRLTRSALPSRSSCLSPVTTWSKPVQVDASRTGRPAFLAGPPPGLPRPVASQ